MDDTRIIQLATLWFVVLIYIQTGFGGGGAVSMAIGVIANVLMYIIPLTLVIFVILQLIDRYTISID